MSWVHVVLLVFLLAAPLVRAQDNVRILSVTCRNATGSAAAQDCLTKLILSNPSAPGGPEAIEDCRRRYEILLEQETAKWNQANDAIAQFDCARARLLLQELRDKRTAYQLKARDELARLGNCTGKSVGSSGTGGTDANKILQQAAGAFNVGDFNTALRLSEPLTSVSGPNGEQARHLVNTIKLRIANNKRFQEVLLAKRKEDTVRACELLGQIEATDPAFPGLMKVRAEMGPCSPPRLKVDFDAAVAAVQEGKLREAQGYLSRVQAANPNYPGLAKELTRLQDLENRSRKERFDRDLERAQEFIEQKKWTQARDLLRRAKSIEPANSRVVSLLEQAEREIQFDDQKSEQQRLTEVLDSARRFLADGNYLGADSECQRAAELRPSEPEVMELRKLVQQAVQTEKAALTQSLAPYYAGDYAQAEQRLDAFLAEKHTPRLGVLARFYLGAAIMSQYLLSGSRDTGKREKARGILAEVLERSPAFNPPWDRVSPKIKEALVGATDPFGAASPR